MIAGIADARLVWLLPFALVSAARGRSARRSIRARALVERAAWTALNAGQAHAAAEGFRDALAADPKNARLHLGAGMAASLERRDADARDEFERALALDPKLAQARALLGQMQYRMGDRAARDPHLRDAARDDARRRRTRARRSSAGGAKPICTIACSRRSARISPSRSKVRQKPSSRPRRSSCSIGAYWRIGQLLGTYPSAPIGVVLYTSEQFRDITRAPSWAAGAYDGIIRVPMRGALEQARGARSRARRTSSPTR